jgi:hypothetical protein
MENLAKLILIKIYCEFSLYLKIYVALGSLD